MSKFVANRFNITNDVLTQKQYLKIIDNMD